MQPIDIILPVFRGFEETQRCIESVLTAPVKKEFELIVINDASPEPELVAYLSSLSEQKKITLIHNNENMGFVATVNKGMQLHEERDVLLLNSDTEVANNWLDRVHSAAYSAEEIGTVTPFSNNATICSYPYFNGAGSATLPHDISLTVLDALVAKTNAGQTAEIPTAVGFCMFIKRDCLNAVGYFDVKRFDRGYGEENDFSQTAALLGWRNVLAADVFVFHAGGVSFGQEQSALQKKAMAALLDKHPDYLYRIDSFTQVDPLRLYRAAIDAARSSLNPDQALLVQKEQLLERVDHPAAQYITTGNARLHITHGWGGGIERWIDNFTSTDSETNFIFQSQTDPNSAGSSLILWCATGKKKSKIAFWKLATPINATDVHHPEYAAILQSLVDNLRIRSIFVSSLIGHALEIFSRKIPTIIILHDLYPFCPAIFAHYAGSTCTHCDLDTLRTCQKHNTMYYFWHNTKPEWWVTFRQHYANAINQPWVQLVAPTQSALARWRQLFPVIQNLPHTIIEHGIDLEKENKLENPVFSQHKRLRILIPGRLDEHKGLQLISELLPELSGFADILLLGCGGKGWAFVDTPNTQIVWDYTQDELANIIADYQPDCALLLSTVPETFSYTLSEMQALGVPVIATNLGAYQERIEHGVSGWLVEPFASSVLNLIHSLDKERQRILVVKQYWEVHQPTSVNQMRRHYLSILPTETLPVCQNKLLEGTAQLTTKLDQEVARLETLNTTLQKSLEVQTQSLEKVQQHATMVEHNFDLQSIQIAELSANQRRLLNSRSWKLTAPLRWFGNAAREGKTILSKLLGQTHDAQKISKPYPASQENHFDTYHEAEVIHQPKTQTRAQTQAQTQTPNKITDVLRKYDVTRLELCEVSGMPLATVWIGLNDPTTAGIYPQALTEFIQSCRKQSNAIRFFMSHNAFQRAGKQKTEESIYRLVTERTVIITPAEWDQNKRQFHGDAMIFFDESIEGNASSICTLQRLGCFLIFWTPKLPHLDLSNQRQMAAIFESDWHTAATRLHDWLATDWDLRQKITKNAPPLPICRSYQPQDDLA